MKFQIILWFFLVLTKFAFGQSAKQIDIPIDTTNNMVDTSILYRKNYNLISQLPLEHLEISKDTFHFRLVRNHQILDISTQNFVWFRGKLTNFETRFYSKDLNKNGIIIEKVFNSQKLLDTSAARQIFILLKKYSIESIPSDYKIKGWKDGLGDKDVLIEISTKNKYTFKSYWSPNLQPASLQEAKQILLFMKEVTKVLNTKEKTSR